MPFDPKAYLAKRSAGAPEGDAPAAGGFDAKAYLAKKNHLSASSADAAGDAEPTVIQEMHPDFSVADRFVAKNLSPTPEDAVSYLQKKHPGLEITSVDGEIRARAAGKKGAKNLEPYRVLDPGDLPSDDSWQMSDLVLHPAKGFAGYGRDLWRGAKEGVMDVTDVLGDVGSGMATSAANVAGGLGGALAGAPLGPPGMLAGGLAGAAAAGGATGLGLEAMKQRLAQAVGAQGEGLNNFNLAVAGGAGAVSPILFGSGASKAAIQAAGVSAASQRGGLGVARDLAAPALQKLGEKFSGIPRDAIKGLSDNLPEIVAAEKSPQGLTSMVRGAKTSLKDAFTSAKASTNAGVDGALSGAEGAMVNMQPTVAELQAAIARAESSAAGTGNEMSKELVAALREKLDKILMHDVETTSTEMVPGKLLDEFGKPLMSPREVTSTTRQAVSELAPRDAVEVKKMLAEAAELGATGTGEVGGRALGKSYVDKGVMHPLAGAKKMLDASLDEAVPGLADATSRQAEVLQAQKTLAPYFKTDKVTAKTLRNMSSADKQILVEQLTAFDAAHGTDLLGAARKVEAYQVFHRPGVLPISMNKASGLVRAGAGVGIGAGAGEAVDHILPGGGHKGRIIGGALGAGLASPAFVRALITASQAGAGSMRPNAVVNSAAPEAAQDIWKYLTP